MAVMSLEVPAEAGVPPLNLRHGERLVTIDAALEAARVEMRNIAGLRGETAGAFLLGMRDRLEA